VPHYIVICGFAGYAAIVPNFLLNGAIFGKLLLNIKCEVWFSLQIISETFIILRRIQRDITINVQTSSRKVSTYYSPKIRKITNLFKNTNTRTAFRSTNTIKRLRKRRTNITPDYDKSSIYKIKCNTCHRSYVGQTKRGLTLRYQEHIRYVQKQ
jgi:hypothetical protein